MSQKIYTKLIKHNLTLITSIDNTYLFLDFIQSNLNFEPSFVGIHQVLREIWLFEHKFQALHLFKIEILANFEFLGGMKFVNKLFIKILNFIRISNYTRNGKVEITKFSDQLVQRSQKNSQPTKIN